MTSRTVVITGASRGIGAATTQTLIDQGCHVIGIARNFTSCTDNDSFLNHENFTACTADLLEFPGLCRKVEEAIDISLVDALVCNAGSSRFGALEQYSPSQINEELQLNLISQIQITRWLLPLLRLKERSNIIYVGSESALHGGRYGAVYSAAKFGLRGFAQSLRYETANRNCHVGIINPGMVRSHFFETLNFEPGDDSTNALETTDVANAIAHMLNSPDHAVVDEINLSPLKKVVKKKAVKK